MARRSTPRSGGATRRQFLLGGAVAGAGAAAALAADAFLDQPPPSAPPTPVLHGPDTIAFTGAHQAGVETPPQAHATLIAWDLHSALERADIVRLMRVLTDDARRLTQGVGALADTEPELALVPARLTVTFALGAGWFARAGVTGPSWLRPLPPFGIDRLEERWSDGDLLVQIAADDAVTVAHAARMLSKDARSFGTQRWVQRGFRRAQGSVRPGTTMRNLFGQLDGTANPEPGTADFARVVWIDDGPFADGTGMVIRRIRMDLDGWDRVDRSGREQSVGRYLANGAPLTGRDEHDEPDFTAKTPLGLPVIADFSHVRRSRSDITEERMFRRAFNYDDEPEPGTIENAGLVFIAFQADVDRQYVPVQRRLDTLDMLNEWTTPIGSAVFFVPAGCGDDGYVGENLLG